MDYCHMPRRRPSFQGNVRKQVIFSIAIDVSVLLLVLVNRLAHVLAYYMNVCPTFVNI